MASETGYEFQGTSRFHLLRRLGGGGMGVVYEALDKERSARVALKTLRTVDATALLRFKNEFRWLADLQHPNLVSLGELFADESAEDPSELAADAVLRSSVRRALADLPERERAILELRFGVDGEPHALEAIGSKLGLTRERVRQLEAQGLRRLQDALAEIDENGQLALSA